MTLNATISANVVYLGVRSVTAAVHLRRSFRACFEAIHEPTESALPLAVFRVLFCSLLLHEIGILFAYRELLFDAVPHVWLSRVPTVPGLFAWAIAVSLILVGYRTRVAAVVNYVFAVLFLGFYADRHDFQGHWDCFTLYAAAMFLLCPVNARLSFDALRKKRGAHSNATAAPPAHIGKIHYWIVALAIGTMYLDSCAYKLASPMYRSGLGLWAPANLPYNLHNAATDLLDNRPLALASGYFAVAFELSYGVLIWFRRIRAWLVVCGIVFHLTILYFFPLWAFSLMVVTFYLALFPAEIYERALAQVRACWEKKPLADSAVPSAKVECTSPYELSRLATTGWVVLWLFSFLVLSFGSPMSQLIGSGPLASRLRSLSGAYRALIYPWTGFSQHGVFVDGHFKNYTTQVRLVLEEPGGFREVPLIAEDGTCLDWNVGRLWVMWTFRTVRPSLPLASAEENLRRFVLHWSHVEGVDLRKERIQILSRPVAVSLDKWQPGLLRQNLAREWTRVGEIFEQAQGLVIQWRRSRGSTATLAQVIAVKPELDRETGLSESARGLPRPAFAPTRRE